VTYGVQFKCKKKFLKQYLVWQAIDQFGNVSEAYIKKGTLKAKEECLKKMFDTFHSEISPEL
jgi:hypothetical protein